MIARSLFLRGLGLVYLAAFLSLEWQVDGLFGSDGLSPVAGLLDRAGEAFGGADPLRLPTVFWLGAGDATLRAACWIAAGFALLLVSATAPLISSAALWVLYLSFVNVGAPFLNYQWDALLLEAGFLAIFWAPATLRLPSPRTPEPSRLVRWALWWLLCRLMFFSGWVKLASGDPSWWDLSALEYHYETQPIPAWTSWWAFQLPAWFQKASAAGTLFIELCLPFFVLFGRRGRAIAAAGFVSLQCFIAATGNYGFFNLLSALLCVPLLDDEQILVFTPARIASRMVLSGAKAGRIRKGASALVAALILVLTVPDSLSQLGVGSIGLERALAPVVDCARGLHVTGRYGLFAVMTRTRPEVEIEGSDDGRTWKPYVFRWKPGLLDRPPAFVAPDMPRLDWQMWFDGLSIERALRAGDPVHRVVTPSLLEKLRRGSPAVRGLLAPGPFEERPPKWTRFRLFAYRFTSLEERRESGRWWKRELVWAGAEGS